MESPSRLVGARVSRETQPRSSCGAPHGRRSPGPSQFRGDVSRETRPGVCVRSSVAGHAMLHVKHGRPGRSDHPFDPVGPLRPTAVRGILRREVAAVRPSLEGPCGRARPSAKSPRIDSPDDPAARRGRSDGDGLAGTDRGSLPADRNGRTASGAGARDRRDGGGRPRSRVWSGPSWGASRSMSSHNGHSVRPHSRCCSAWRRLRCSADVLVRVRPVVPIIATLVLSVLYSMIHFVALNALVAPIPVTDPVSLVLPERRSTTPSWRP